MTDVFDLLLSSDPNTCSYASKVVLVMANSEPKAFIENFEKIKLIIIALCCSPTPSFETISHLIIGISNGIGESRENFDKFIIPLLNLSETVSECFLKTDLFSQQFFPDMSPIGKLINSHLANGMKLSLDLIIAMTKPMKLGLLPFDSFDDILLDNMESVVDVVIDAYKNGQSFEHVFDPLISANKRIAILFVVIALKVLANGGNKPGIVDAIIEHAASIATLEESVPSFLSYLPVILLIAAKATDEEFVEIQKILKSSMDGFIKTIRSDRENTKRRPSVAVVKTNEVIFAVHRAQVNVIEQQRIFSKVWVKHWLTFIEEPRILLWSNDKYTNKGGVVFQLSELSSIEIMPENYVENKEKNIMKITKGKEVYTLSFDSYAEAVQWKNVFKQVK